MLKRQKGLLFAGLVIGIGLITACEKDKSSTEKDYLDEITGSYQGQLFSGGNLDSGTPASALVSVHDEGQIEIQCTDEFMDTTFIMDIYEHGDSIMACFTGESFEQEYGHMKDNNHMMHQSSNQSEWEHHMDDNHEPGDEHYSNFDMEHHTFRHRFEVMQDNKIQYIEFIGSKI